MLLDDPGTHATGQSADPHCAACLPWKPVEVCASEMDSPGSSVIKKVEAGPAPQPPKVVGASAVEAEKGLVRAERFLAAAHMVSWLAALETFQSKTT